MDCWFAYALFAKHLRLGFLTWFFNFLSVISIFVTIGKYSLLYSQLLQIAEDCDLCMSRCALGVTVHTPNYIQVLQKCIVAFLPILFLDA